jgi:putative addiction module component (TIGR02574 family)
MATTYEQVKAEAMRLTKRQRIRLAHQLAKSITFRSREIEEAWAKEIERRVAEIDAGTAVLIDSDEAIASARRAVEEARKNR